MKVTVVILAPQLLDDQGQSCGRSSDAIRDSCSNKNLRILFRGEDIGYAINLEKKKYKGEAALFYLCELVDDTILNSLTRDEDGLVIGKEVEAAGSPTGIYPTAIHLCAKHL